MKLIIPANGLSFTHCRSWGRDGTRPRWVPRPCSAGSRHQLHPSLSTSLHFTSLHFTSLHFTSLHFTSLHFTHFHSFYYFDSYLYYKLPVVEVLALVLCLYTEDRYPDAALLILPRHITGIFELVVGKYPTLGLCSVSETNSGSGFPSSRQQFW